MTDAPLLLTATASSGLPVAFTLVSGPATLNGVTVTPTASGTVTVRASQGGNGSFNAAPDVEHSFTVSRASQTIDFDALANKTFGEGPFAVSATASSGLAPAFSLVSGPATLSGRTVTMTGAGPVVIRASQAGDTTYNAAADVQRGFDVAKAPQTIAFGPLANKTVLDPSFSVGATATSGLPPTFSVVGGPATISGSTVTLSGLGLVTIRASQGGDANYQAAAPTEQSFTVSRANQTLTFGPLENRTFGDTPFALSATASSGLAPSLSVVSGPATISGNTLTLTGVGTVKIRASQAGNTSYNAAVDAEQSFTVSRANQTINFGPLVNKTFGDPPFPIGATASSGFAPTLSVVSGPATIAGNTMTLTGAGTVTIRASLGASANYNAATEADQTFAVDRANQTLTFGPLVNRTFGDPPFPISATASSGLAPSYSVASGPATIAGNVVTLTGAGNVTLRVSQTGNGNYSAAPDLQQGFAVARAVPLISWAAPATITYGTTLSGTQLNATANVPGTFAFTPTSGAVLAAGDQPLSVAFSPANAANYTTATGGQTLTVNKAPLIAKAQDKTKAQGDANPGLSIAYTGWVNGDTSAALSPAPTGMTTATTASPPGSYSITLAGGGAANYSLTLQDGTLVVIPAGTQVSGTQSIVGNGYIAGGTVTITNTIAYVGVLSSLGWSVVLPAGWSYVASNGSEGDVKPTAGAAALLDWAWTAVPASPFTFTYTLNVPAGQVGNQPLAGLLIARMGGPPIQIMGQPDPLVVRLTTAHSADTDGNLRFSLLELTRMIELFNVRNGTARTGAYGVQDGSEDGFAPEPTRPGSLVVTLARYHSADSNHDGKLSLLELTRVIELFNHRVGTQRTGQYHVQPGTEDGFAPGP
ncbi:MAG: hypothetical protein RLZZ15_2220 [Verrucomicrobiota bacterium]